MPKSWSSSPVNPSSSGPCPPSERPLKHSDSRMPMDETEPVEESEIVYRRIHPRFYQAGSPVAILFEAFRPNRHDGTGISVLRARFAKPQNFLANVDPLAAGGHPVAPLCVVS